MAQQHRPHNRPVLRAISEFDLGHPLVDETARWLVVPRSSQPHNGASTAQAIAALADFAEATGELLGAYEYSVLLQQAVLIEGYFETAR